MDFPSGSDGKEPACNARDPGLTPGSGRSSGEGIGYTLQYSCLENSMDRGAWWATVHGVAKSWRWLKWLSTHVPKLLCGSLMCSFLKLNNNISWHECNNVSNPFMNWRTFVLFPVLGDLLLIKPLEYSKKNHQSKVRRNYFGEIFHLGNYDTCKNSSILILRTQWLFRTDFAK